MPTLLALLLAAGLIVTGVSPAEPQATRRHSGSVVSVDLTARSLVLAELVEEGRPRHLQVRVPEGAAVVFSERIADDRVPRFDAAFDERRIELSDVRPGDFVVVEGATQGSGAVATALVVTLRVTEAGAASPASPDAQSRP
jgi:hypothetical protein